MILIHLIPSGIKAVMRQDTPQAINPKASVGLRPNLLFKKIAQI